ncbi:hypothetical protein Pfo_031620 [Paulownia fortunei]|nr:hypothetical protein Pfo_031620 [Paulownia fortunei]
MPRQPGASATSTVSAAAPTWDSASASSATGTASSAAQNPDRSSPPAGPVRSSPSADAAGASAPADPTGRARQPTPAARSPRLRPSRASEHPPVHVLESGRRALPAQALGVLRPAAASPAAYVRSVRIRSISAAQSPGSRDSSTTPVSRSTHGLPQPTGSRRDDGHPGGGALERHESVGLRVRRHEHGRCATEQERQVGTRLRTDEGHAVGDAVRGGEPTQFRPRSRLPRSRRRPR